jgi:hypothetical protein
MRRRTGAKPLPPARRVDDAARSSLGPAEKEALFVPGLLKPTCTCGHAETARDGEHQRRWLIVVASIIVELAGIWLRALRLGGKVVVATGKTTLFTTIWIPEASLKSIRLGWWRFQHCPVER